MRARLLAFAAMVAALCSLGIATAPAGACTASDQASLDACMAQAVGGDTVTLADGTYPDALTVGAAYTGDPVVIEGSSTAGVNLAGGFTFKGTAADVELKDVSVSPVTGQTKKAKVAIGSGATGIVLDGLLLDGSNAPTYGVGVNLNTNGGIGASDVTIENSEWRRCGDANFGAGGSPGRCIDISNANGVLITGNTFDDGNFQAKVIHGYGSNVTISHNHFGSIWSTPGCTATCQHMEDIHLEGGDSSGWLIDSNTFGDCGYDRDDPDNLLDHQGNCTSSIFDGTANASDITIQNNKWFGATNASEGYIFIGDVDESESGWVIRNNTAEADSAIPSDKIGNLVEFGGQWSDCSPSCGFLMENNVSQYESTAACTKANRADNLVESGTSVSGGDLSACFAAGDTSGPANFNSFHDPTSSSSNVIDLANSDAPPLDFYGRSVVGSARDLGAVEARQCVHDGTC